MSQEIREDIAIVPTAQKLGFSVKSLRNDHQCYVDYNPETSIPRNPLSFEIGNVVVWTARGGWRFAQIIDGNFLNHSDVIYSLQACLWAAKGRHERVQAS
ncbi:hypothetical protein OTK49_20900 [Vibrio coralliirubri]|uniref:hypothetical protein n=1 Tax=Vibrio coralliirubri TaxID=1516159 RepID=UPI00228385D6|nr:hypothetical protein [Vibrio coralliirubri]MCY9864978.1 hypothetical protein [Vibrio coralliirubri]